MILFNGTEFYFLFVRPYPPIFDIEAYMTKSIKLQQGTMITYDHLCSEVLFLKLGDINHRDTWGCPRQFCH